MDVRLQIVDVAVVAYDLRSVGFSHYKNLNHLSRGLLEHASCFFFDFAMMDMETSGIPFPEVSRSGLHFLEWEIGISPWGLAMALLPLPTL